MKILIKIIFFVCMLGNLSYAQEKTAPQTPDVLPYLKYPKLPAFNIMLMDSSTIFNTYNIPSGKPIAILFFDPNCKHCKSFTEAMVRGMDSVKNVRFYMITSNHSYEALREYYKTYGLDKYKNIEVVGRDYEFFFITYYGAKSFPTVALYDGNKKLVTLLEDIKDVSGIYEWTSKLKK